jgi:hypothetical protein
MIGTGAARSAPAAVELRVVVQGDSPWQAQVLQGLERRFGSLRVSTDPNGFGVRGGSSVYVTLNASALAGTLAADLPSPLVALFTSSEHYWSLSREAGRRRKRGMTAIFAEVSPLHQMQLITGIYQRRVKVGVLLTEATAYAEPLLQQAARDNDLDLQIEQLAPSSDVLRALTRVSSANVLLAIPDRALYTPTTLRDILESTYRRGQPMIGFSTAMVRAGTLATAYPNVDDTIAHLHEVIETIESGRTPEPQYPKYWRVAINENVARSLNVVITDTVRAMGNKPREGGR